MCKISSYALKKADYLLEIHALVEILHKFGLYIPFYSN